MGDSDEPSGAVLALINQWLARVESKIDTLFMKLDAKADKTELAELRQQIESKADKADMVELEHRLGDESRRTDAVERDLDHRVKSGAERKEWRQFVMPTILSVALLAVAVIQLMKG